MKDHLAGCSVNQLDLFADSPREYNTAMHFLGMLEIEKCRQALVHHMKRFPASTRPDAALEACDWLEPVLCGDACGGALAMDACIALWTNRAPGFSGLPGAVGVIAMRTLALRAIEVMKSRAARPTDIVGAGLPWGAFFLFAGKGAEAISSLKVVAVSSPLSGLPRILIADALWSTSRRDACLEHYRDGYGRDPDGSGWRPLDTRVGEFRKEVLSEDIFGEDWWVVGAYLAGRFPPFRKKGSAELLARLQVFEDARESGVQDSVVFLLGTELSVQGIEMPRLIRVRKAMAKLHPEGFKLHMEQVAKVIP